jgi:hypothetical protein
MIAVRFIILNEISLGPMGIKRSSVVSRNTGPYVQTTDDTIIPGAGIFLLMNNISVLSLRNARGFTNAIHVF